VPPVIATRVLKLRRADSEIDIAIRIFAPEAQATHWECWFEIDWPDRTLRMAAMGVDAVQALELMLKMIGTHIYTNDHHKSGKLMWLRPGQGYGFPVPNSLRDLLVGEDQKYL
jgi:hypothetical protein